MVALPLLYHDAGKRCTVENGGVFCGFLFIEDFVLKAGWFQRYFLLLLGYSPAFPVFLPQLFFIGLPPNNNLFSGTMLCEAIRLVPGNRYFDKVPWHCLVLSENIL